MPTGNERVTLGRRAAAVVGLALLPGLTACATAGDAAEGADGTTLTVFAAASLRPTFETLGQEFESSHDGVRVRLAFAGSSDLVAQLRQGADADVVALADAPTMDRLVADGLAADPVDFAANTLTIAVPTGNPAGVSTTADLARDGINLVVCAPAVPCGAAAAKVEEASGLDFEPVSEEQSVTDVLNKVATGEADAGLVYVTDVLAAGDRVEGVDLPEAAGAVNAYPIATVTGGDAPDLAQEFVDLVLSPTGRAVLADAGFATP